MGAKLTEYEVEVLKMLDGQREFEWGAWVGACLEQLASEGYCTRSMPYQITPAGRAALEGGKDA